MAKPKHSYRCKACGATTARWQGRCPRCQAWDTLEEERQTPAAAARPAGPALKPQRLSELRASAVRRIQSGYAELDRVLGGGLVPGSVVLLGGAPGIGKSTLALQWLGRLRAEGVACVYQSGEESPEQLAQRAARLRPASIQEVEILGACSVESLAALIRSGSHQVVVVDSIQTLRREANELGAGSTNALREATGVLVEAAKQAGVALLIIGHITKDGSLAGPKLLEHLVDVVLAFEGQPASDYRVVRGIKNRFGAAQAMALFEMRAFGLSEVEDATRAFIGERPEGVAGSVVAAATSGSRALLLEVQALVAPAAGAPRRVASGCEHDRLAIMLAVLERKLDYRFSDQDVFVSVAGGLDLSERALDLPIAVTLASAHTGRAMSRTVCCFGEVGLAGEVRSVPQAALRVSEAARVGFERVVMPKRSIRASDPDEAQLDEAVACAVPDVREAIRVCLGG